MLEEFYPENQKVALIIKKMSEKQEKFVKYKLGKILNKFLIAEILSIGYYTSYIEIMFKTSLEFRKLLKENFNNLPYINFLKNSSFNLNPED